MTTTLAPSAWWFDGRRAAAVPVSVAIDGDRLLAADADGQIRAGAALSAIDVPERFERGPLMLRFPGGTTVVVDEPAHASALETVLARPPSLVRRLQASWPVAVAGVALLVAALAALYWKGVPWAAERIAEAMPPSVEQRIGGDFLKLLDRKTLVASALPEAERRRLAQRFAEFAGRSAPGETFRLEFRALKNGKGVNAFALPGGTIVLLDGLVEAGGDDERVLAVLGHELGHIALRHPIRRVVKTVGIGVLAGLVWGDISSVAAHAGTVVGALHYSRQQELAADDFAVKVLNDNGLDARPLIEMFAILKSEAQQRGGVPDFLATHPATDDRIQRLRKLPVRLKRDGPPPN